MALTQAARRILLISPWIRRTVITTDFVSKLESRLKRGVDVHIAHGYEEDDFFEVLASSPIKRRSQRGLADVYELFGRNLEGSYVHVVYRRAHGRAIVFHMHTMTNTQRRYYRKHMR